MRNDLWRFVLSGVGAALFLGLCTYVFLNYERYYPLITGFSQDPSSYEGRVIELEGKIVEREGRYYIASTSNIPVEIKYDWSKEGSSKPGSAVILGVLHKEGIIEVLGIHPRKHHMVKYYVSGLGIIIFLFIFFKEWRVSLKGFKERGERGA